MSTVPPRASQTSAVPLWSPYYGASFGVAFTRFWKKYADFTGRASRSEYWWWVLVVVILSFLWEVIGLSTGSMGGASGGASMMTRPGFVGYAIVASVWGLATIIPTLSLLARRLHDANLRGWWMLLGLIPIVGDIILLVFTLLPPKAAGARFDRAR